MVRIFLFLMLLPFSFLVSHEVSIIKAVEGERVWGNIVLDPSASSPSSFYLGKHWLPVEKVDEKTFRFSLCPQVCGKACLEPIGIKKGKQITYTPAVDYYVEKKNRDASSLECVLDAPTPLYPGHPIRWFYRFTFHQPLEVSQIYLSPMEDERVIAKRANEAKLHQGVDDQTLEYCVEGAFPAEGNYRIPSSQVKGNYFFKNFLGEKKEGEIFFLESLPSFVTVSSFPETNSQGFQGAIGDFDIEFLWHLHPQIYVGDKISLEMHCKGQGSFSSLHPPVLEDVEGFQVEETQEEGNRFLTILQVLKEGSFTLPEGKCVFFNPHTMAYEEKKSSKQMIVATYPQQEKLEPSFSIAENLVPFPKQIQEVRVVNHSLFWDGVIIFGCLFVLIFQVILKGYLKKEKRVVAKEKFHQAIRLKKDSHFFSFLEEAFIARLVEVGELKDACPLRHLLDEGIQGEVKAFFLEMERNRFMGKTLLVKQIVKQGKALFERLG